jgi:uncharacterized protein YbjT (DUF2867 family)
MADHQGPVLVIGATGQQGGATARHLLERGRTVHALVADLAAETGVEHPAYSSLNGAGARSGIPYYESKSRIEKRIHALGLPAKSIPPNSQTFRRCGRTTRA